MRRPLLTLCAVAATAALAVTGCSSGSGSSSTSSKSPQAAFAAGLQGVSDTDVLTVTLRFDTTADKFLAIAAEQPGGSKPTAKEAQEVAGGALVIETKTTDGSKLSQLKGGSTAKTNLRLSFTENGADLAHLQSNDSTLYVQADVKTLVSTFGNAKQYADLQARAAQLPAFVQDFVRGNWVALDLNAISALASQFGGGATTSNPGQGQKIVNDLRQVLTRNFTATRVGTDSAGDHLRLSGHARPLVSDLVRTLASDVPMGGLATSSFKPESVDNVPIVIDAWVSNGSLSKLSLDVVQFMKVKKPGDTLPLVLTLQRSGADISKPANATPVNTQQLMTMIGALSGK